MSMPLDCYACRLTQGQEPLPGGRIWATQNWVVEHCTGPVGAGTFIVKPFRHCVHIEDLTAAEVAELGPLLQRVSHAVRVLAESDQVTFAYGRTRDRRRCTFISSSNRRGTGSGSDTAVPALRSRRRCLKLGTHRRSQKSSACARRREDFSVATRRDQAQAGINGPASSSARLSRILRRCGGTVRGN
jgi:hypothetical protein